MIENRELSMDDYLAMLRRRAKVILFPAVLAPLAGFLVSFSFPAKYTSQSAVVVEEQKVPDAYVKPMITEDVMQRAEAIRAHVRAYVDKGVISKFAVPDKVTIVKDLPLTSVGKVDKAALRERLLREEAA